MRSCGAYFQGRACGIDAKQVQKALIHGWRGAKRPNGRLEEQWGEAQGRDPQHTGVAVARSVRSARRSCLCCVFRIRVTSRISAERTIVVSNPWQVAPLLPWCSCRDIGPWAHLWSPGQPAGRGGSAGGSCPTATPSRRGSAWRRRQIGGPAGARHAAARTSPRVPSARIGPWAHGYGARGSRRDAGRRRARFLAAAAGF